MSDGTRACKKEKVNGELMHLLNNRGYVIERYRKACFPVAKRTFSSHMIQTRNVWKHTDLFSSKIRLPWTHSQSTVLQFEHVCPAPSRWRMEKPRYYISLFKDQFVPTCPTRRSLRRRSCLKVGTFPDVYFPRRFLLEGLISRLFGIDFGALNWLFLSPEKCLELRKRVDVMK